MKKHLTSTAAVCTVMRLLLIQLLIVTIVVGNSFANEIVAQDLLQQKVSLSVKQKEIREVLSSLENKVGVKFVYSSRTLSRRKVTLDIVNKPLLEALEELFKPSKISSKIIGGQVVINLESSLLDVVPATEGNETINERTITGSVKDEKNEGLPGVSVVIKNTLRGTVTDTEGNFSLSLPDGDSVLVFSFVGYLPQEVAVGNQSILEISLLADTKGLEEVVVVGYGTQKIANVTGSVASISSKDVKGIPTSNLVTGLAGSCPDYGLPKVRANPDLITPVSISADLEIH